MKMIQTDREDLNYAFLWVNTSELEIAFLQLAEQWRQETGMYSIVFKIVIHPAYIVKWRRILLFIGFVVTFIHIYLKFN
jgi:hypothetical protein